MQYLTDYEQELNAAQRAAVQAQDGPYLVIAGAGSGKTRILVYRVALLVESGVLPQNILLLTFTRKAAQEMLHRATQLLDERCRQVSGGTFHSFAHLLLRRNAAAVGLPASFTIMDQGDAENAVHAARQELQLDKAAEREFPKKRALLHMISKSVNTGDPLSNIIYEEYPHFFTWAAEIQQVQERYVAFKRQKGVLDFDDLLVLCRELLRNNASLRSELSRRYRYIMVDEYQDTNQLQADILYELLNEHNNIMAVGDDSQSIYAFRGANFKNIMRFPEHFPGATVIKLEENYRSVQPILSLTNEIISCAAEKFDKQLYSQRSSATLPVCVETYDEYSQARYVCGRIRSLQQQGVMSGDIAVLFRSGWHSNALELELAKYGMPFVKYGGLKFVDAAHVKDLLSCLRVVVNPQDVLSWQRALTLLPGVGSRTAAAIAEQMMSGADGGLSRGSRAAPVRQFLNGVVDAGRPERAPADSVRIMRAVYQPLFEHAYDDYHKRQGDLDALERIAERYDSLVDFLADMSLDPPEPQEKTAVRQDATRVVLSTIHSAKGLEWHTVFILFVCDGHIPSYQSLDKPESLEEERRLLYVAMTRAREHLYLLQPRVDYSSRAQGNRASTFTEPSRFLHDVRRLHNFVNTEVDTASQYGYQRTGRSAEDTQDYY